MAAGFGGQGATFLGITWAETFIAFLLVAARARTAAFSPHGTASSTQLFGLRWDFWWVSIAFTLALAAQSFMTVSTYYGTNNHQDLLSYEDLVLANLWSWIGQVVAISAAAMGRFAVIAFLLALQGASHPKLKWFLYIVGALQATINGIEIVLILLQCDPVNKLWDPMVPGECPMIEVCSKVGYLQGSIGSFADLALALYPILIVGRLQQMKMTLKVGLCIVMSGGVVAFIAGVNKTIAIGRITETQDITYTMFGLLAWVFTEMWFIIIFGSIPCLRPFFRRMGQRLTATFSRQTTARSQLSTRHYRVEGIQLQPSRNTYSCKTQVGRQIHDKEKDLTESEENILPRPGQIVVRKDTTVENDLDALSSHKGVTEGT